MAARVECRSRRRRSSNTSRAVRRFFAFGYVLGANGQDGRFRKIECEIPFGTASLVAREQLGVHERARSLGSEARRDVFRQVRQLVGAEPNARSRSLGELRLSVDTHCESVLDTICVRVHWRARVVSWIVELGARVSRGGQKIGTVARCETERTTERPVVVIVVE